MKICRNDYAAREWVESYCDLDEYLENCKSEKSLSALSLAMADDSFESGYGDVDPNEIRVLLVERSKKVQLISGVSKQRGKSVIRTVSGEGIAVKGVQSILRYPGAKSRKSVAMRILTKRPKEFSEYREPFCGGAGIAMMIDPRIQRWINDLDERPMTIMKALRDDPDGFLKACREISPLAPNEKPGQPDYESGRARLRRAFEDAQQGKLGNKAVEYYFLNRTAHSARTASEKQYFSAPERWNIIMGDRLISASERLKGTRIVKAG